MRRDDHKPLVVFTVTNCICFDQRVQKMAGTIDKLGAGVIIVGKMRGECCNRGIVPFRTRRFRMIFGKGFLFYMFFNLRLLLFLLFHKADIIVANDLDTLLPAFLVSRLKNVSLIFDSHEYFTGVPELLNRKFVRGVWKSIEKAIFPRLKHTLTVSESIADIYLNEYGIRPLVVRNCAPRTEHIEPAKRDIPGAGEGKLLLILQGGGINIHKGGEELIEAMGLVGNAILMIIGSGDVISDLKKRASVLSLGDRVHFFPRMPWHEMMRYTRAADAGLSLEKDTNLNYRYSLPNKLFDYLSAGIPVIAGDLPEMTRIISEHSCGIIIPEIRPDEIAQAVKLLDGNRDLLKVLKQNAMNAAAELNWENESLKVKELYINLLTPNK